MMVSADRTAAVAAAAAAEEQDDQNNDPQGLIGLFLRLFPIHSDASSSNLVAMGFPGPDL